MQIRRVSGSIKTALTFALLTAFSVSAEAAVFVLDFEGLQSLEEVEDFYDGGFGSLGSGPGPDFGVIFEGNTLALQSTHPDANFANPPSPSTIMFFLTGTAIMNVAAGFDTGFSFFYTSTTFAGSVTVYDGLGATGNVVGVVNLPALGSCGAPDPFCNWAPVGVAFSGTARSVDFSGVVNQIGFDNITLGSPTAGGGQPVAEPTTLAMLGLALTGLAIRRRRTAATWMSN